MEIKTNKTWEQLWQEFKKLTNTEDTYLFYKWIEEKPSQDLHNLLFAPDFLLEQKHTRPVALRVLRNFATTGIIDWKI